MVIDSGAVTSCPIVFATATPKRKGPIKLATAASVSYKNLIYSADDLYHVKKQKAHQIDVLSFS